MGSLKSNAPFSSSFEGVLIWAYNWVSLSEILPKVSWTSSSTTNAGSSTLGLGP